MRYQQVEWRSVAALPSIGVAAADFKLASDAPDVSPLLSSGSLEKTLRRLPSGAIQRTLRHGVVPVAWWPDHVLYATCGQKGTDYATHHGLPVMARIEPHDFHHCVHRVWGQRILRKATHGLLAARPQFSAKTRVTGPQMFAFLVFMMCLPLCSMFLTAGAIWIAASALVGMFFLSVVTLRLFCMFPVPPAKAGTTSYLSAAELPRYSVLVPVFRETAVLAQLLRAMSHLDYPLEKLEIKIIVEEFDTTLRQALLKIDLPPHIEIIVVPHGSPQTKPRALNYALQFCRGSLLTIYDAEDVPEPKQLREAAHAFANAGENLACLQAKLIPFNPDENWLTRGIMAQMPQAA